MTENIQETFHQALDEFVSNEADLISADANERTISSKLAEYMGKYFSGWDVNCEYNRLGAGRQKLIDLSRRKFKEAKAKGIIPERITDLDELEKSGLGVSVFPDIIVHHRGHEFENLLIVEVKKSNNPDIKLGWDEFKIDFFMRVLGYEAGAFIIFNVNASGDNKANYVECIKWFE